MALWLAVREARRVRAGDRRARPWFAFFLTSATVLTVVGVEATLAPHRSRWIAPPDLAGVTIVHQAGAGRAGTHGGSYPLGGTAVWSRRARA